MSSALWHDVRCSSCRRRIGVSNSATTLRNSIYCDAWCLSERPTTALAHRNDLWRELVAFGYTPVEVSKMWGVFHSAVYKVLAK